MEPVSLSVCLPAVADLHSKIMDAPPGSKCFQCHAVFGKIRQNLMLAPPGGLVLSPREILDLPLVCVRFWPKVELNDFLCMFVCVQLLVLRCGLVEGNQSSIYRSRISQYV